MPYNVYKRCPQLFCFLWKIIKVIWRRDKIVEYWKYSEGIWILREEENPSIQIHFSIKYWREHFFLHPEQEIDIVLQNNNYIDTSEQKGGVPGITGCMEHTGVILQLLKE